MRPSIDINLIVYNGERHLASSVHSVLAQTWDEFTLTLIDDGSTDGTAEVVADLARLDGRIRTRRNRINVGPGANFQRALWHGDADFVMPKSADDMIAPDFLARVMELLLAQPDHAMCHASGVTFDDDNRITGAYPAGHALEATHPDPFDRACHVMRRYTTSPSFWGVFRRSALDRCARLAYRAGWDHVVLAELALYGAISHVPEPLYWRRSGGRPVDLLARVSTERVNRGLKVTDPEAELRWLTPLITTAYAHIETFAVSRIEAPLRLALMAVVPALFQKRWGRLLDAEADRFVVAMERWLAQATDANPVDPRWRARMAWEAINAVQTILPHRDLDALMREANALVPVPIRPAA